MLLSLFAVMVSITSVALLFDGSYFSYHPACMILGIVALMSCAIFEEKQNKSHWLHMILHMIAVTLQAIGFYIIYQIKIAKQKQHFMTWHSYLGLTAFAMASGMVLFAPLIQWPSKPRNKRILHGVHHLGGKFIYFVGLLACATGWYTTMQANTVSVAVFCCALLILLVAALK